MSPGGEGSRIYMVTGAAEIARRRALVPPGRLVEVWADLYTGGQFWLGETSKSLLDSVGPPLVANVAVEAAAVPIHYGPRLADRESLPAEDSLRARVLSARGVAVAWITLDQFGDRNLYEPTGPTDPVFYLRRPGGTVAHVWRLFRDPREARLYMAEYYGKDSRAREWADALGPETFDDLIRRHARGA